MSLINQRQQEATNIALKRYELTMQREAIDEQLKSMDQRMRELTVIIKTAEHAEAEKQQALKSLREELTAKPAPESAPEQTPAAGEE